MSKQIIVFNELLLQLSAIPQMVEKIGGELVEVEGGKEALEKTTFSPPAAIILDVAMPQMSGIEVCRKTKESVMPAPIVILVSSFSSSSIQERALSAGCDLFATYEEAIEKIPLILATFDDEAKAKVEASSEPKLPRTAPRVPFPGPLEFIVGEENFPGWLINASRSGALFAAASELEVGKAVSLEIAIEEEEKFTFGATTVRTIKLKEPVHDFPFAVGAKFEALDEEHREKLESLIAARVDAEKKRLQITPDFARTVLEGEPSLLQGLVLGTEENSPFAPFLEEIQPFEKEAFANEDPFSLCIQRLTLLRVQFFLFAHFTPYLAKNKGSVLPSFLGSLTDLLRKADALEAEADEIVRKAVAEDDEQARQTINQASNQMHQFKTELLFAVDENLSPEGLGPEGEILTTISQRVETLRVLNRGDSDEVKYGRRTKPTPEDASQDKGSTFSLHMSKKVWIPMALVLLIGCGVLVANLLGGRVSTQELELPLVFSEATIEERTLVITAPKSSWEVLGRAGQSQTLTLIEHYLRKNNLRQTKIYDEAGRLLGAIMSSGGGRKIQYRQKII